MPRLRSVAGARARVLARGPRIPTELALRAAAGLAIAGAIAVAAGRAGSLAPSGQWAAAIVGTAASIAGWGWAALLVAWFVVSSALTRLGQRTKRERTASSLTPSSARTAMQVAANGGVFVLSAVLGTLTGDARFSLMALGALAAASADTWATEVGLLWGGPPRALFGGGRLAPGMSGGVTPIGFAASAAGALAVVLAGAALVPSLSWERTIASVAVAGFLGALFDSALGATVQARRFCATCERFTERETHDCGTRTAHARGLRWMTNDTVNFLATVVGALAALGLGLTLSGL